MLKRLRDQLRCAGHHPSNERILPSRFLRYATFVCICAAFGGMLFGFDIAVISGTVPAVKRQFALDRWLEGFFVASALLGCMVGSALAGPISDAVGRKKVLIASSILFLATGLGCGLAPDFTFLVAFRFIGGIGIGVASMICPLYIAEISPTSIRGRMVTLFQLAIATGSVSACFPTLRWNGFSTKSHRALRMDSTGGHS